MAVDSIELDNLQPADDVACDKPTGGSYSGLFVQTVKLVNGDADSASIVNDANPLDVDLPDFDVDANNSTTSTLTANTDYTGTATDLSAYSGVTVNIFADQNSDASGMKFQFSSDGTNWDIDVGGGFDYVANTGRQFQFPCFARYFRVIFQNAGTGQTAFRLQTLLHHHAIALTSIHRADAAVAVDRSCELVKSILIAQSAGAGDFEPVQATAGGNLKVSIEEDGSATLATSANQTTIIGHVDGIEALLTTIDADTGNLPTIETNTDFGTVTGGGTEAGALRVTLASDSTGQVTVDGTVTANAGTNLNTSALALETGGNLATIAGDTTSLDGKVPSAAALSDNFANPTTAQFGAMAMVWDGATWDRAPGDATNGLTVNLGSNNDVTVTGTVTVDLGANNDVTIDNSSIVHAEDAAHSSGNAGVMTLAVRNDDLAALAGTDGDYAPLQVSQNGALLICPSANDDYKYAVIDDATSGDNTIVAAVTSRKIRVLSCFLVAAGTVTARFESGAAGTALTGQMNLIANTGFVLPHNPAGWFETAAGTLLNLELSAAVSVDGSITYIEVP